LQKGPVNLRRNLNRVFSNQPVDSARQGSSVPRLCGKVLSH